MVANYRCGIDDLVASPSMTESGEGYLTEMQKDRMFILRQPPKGENDDYDDENS